ncbi:MAG: hypothetical protein MRJ67_06260 [Nitrospirales bacterium]|nr:hypothetical protein [Nitrospira sp.]MDR4460107.1 hypothetical protein [Nitrospirales bacterium]MDR4482974.1 hypothetical protein [Nitrospirales bacterium]
MALKKKSIRRASKKRTPSPTKKHTPSRKKGPVSSKKGTTTRKKGIANRKHTPPQRIRTTRAPGGIAKTIEALNERLDIMLPEVMFRIAAIEHLLVKNQLCLYDELTNARQFIQEQERT